MEIRRNDKEPLQREILTRGSLYVREKNHGEVGSRTVCGEAIVFNTQSVCLWNDDTSEAYEKIAPEAVTRAFLDMQDIKMTMFHDRQLILARSNKGVGTLTYKVEKDGVYFEFEAPQTADGDKALELVRRGDIAGCSFMFSTYYNDPDYVTRAVEVKGDRSIITYTVKKLTGIYDFTLAADPAYNATNVETREFLKELREIAFAGVKNVSKAYIREMIDKSRESL